jgi:hypothetical protein
MIRLIILPSVWRDVIGLCTRALRLVGKFKQRTDDFDFEPPRTGEEPGKAVF